MNKVINIISKYDKIGEINIIKTSSPNIVTGGIICQRERTLARY